VVDVETALHLRRLERDHRRHVLEDVIDFLALVLRELVDGDDVGVDLDGGTPHYQA
jgi:hypothetical protein